MQDNSTKYEWEDADNEPDPLRYDGDESILDTYDGDWDSRNEFEQGYFDAGRYDYPMQIGTWYLVGFKDRKHEISMGIPASLEFFPVFEEF